MIVIIVIEGVLILVEIVILVVMMKHIDKLGNQIKGLGEHISKLSGQV